MTKNSQNKDVGLDNIRRPTKLLYNGFYGVGQKASWK
jgi:hypothetical protein